MTDALYRLLRILLFQADRDDLMDFDRTHLYVGLFFTWLAGMGRYWDEPNAVLAQQLGLGSVAYVFVLALLLWGVIAPMRVAGLRYVDVLTFVSLTSPPALLYAIPVERFTDMSTAAEINAWFLAIVAAWRVALWFFFLMRRCGLRWFTAVTCEILPLSLIVSALAFLNLERATFDLMGGLRTSKDGAYMLVSCLAALSMFAFVPFLIAWIVLAVEARNSAKAAETRAAILAARAASGESPEAAPPTAPAQPL